MSKGGRLTTEHSLSLAQALRAAVTEFAQREEALTREFNSKRYHLQRGHREALHQVDSKIGARLSSADAITHQHEEHARGLYNARRGRIQRIHHSDLGDVQLNARRAKEKFLSDLQLRHFNAKKNLPGLLEKADEAHAKYSAQVQEEYKIFARVDRFAADSMSGHAALRKLLQREQPISGDRPGKPEEALKAFSDQIRKANEEIKAFRKLPLPAFFRSIPLAGWIVVVLATCGVVGFMLRAMPNGPLMVGGGGVLLIALIALLHRLGTKQGMAAAQKIAASLAEAAQRHEECRAAANIKHGADRRAAQEHYDSTKSDLDNQWQRGQEIEDEYTRNAEEKFGVHIPRALATADRVLAARLAKIQQAGAARRGAIEQETAKQREALVEAQQRETAALAAEEAAKWDALTADWNGKLQPLYVELQALQTAIAATSPALDSKLAESWTAPYEFTPATRFAALELDLSPNAPKNPRLALPGPAKLEIPVALAFPEQGSLLLETEDSGTPAVSGALNLLILRLLATMPPGKVSFTILDPVSLGQNFAGLMHLSDYEENLINRRIWTQRDQIEERLAELNEHIEKVIQMYLRNEFATITEYNAQAGSVAEKYHFLVIADFPANFGEGAVKRLQSIISSGPRCGVFTLMHWDRRQAAPEGLVTEELHKNCVALRSVNGSALSLGAAQEKAGATLQLDPVPEAAVAGALVHKIGQASIDSNRVEVPFSQIAPKPDDYWTNETTHELRIPIGRSGATKMQYLAIGKGTRQHALFAGKTGSGKSTLFHVIITNLALACSPEQVEFYLIDFKKGVEFKCYASKHLPHARVVAIESDREFGLSVLQRVDEELKRRGDMFRKLGVQDIAGYKKAGGTEPMPRSLLIIDEFQEFFTEDDTIAQSASMLFDRIVRQGRAFGIHVLLGSQTLGGAYTLARATLGQMVIRVALQCNEADAYLIMDENNSAPRLLSRPGEGIYNDAAGAVEGNSPFQVVWLADDDRDRLLENVRALAERKTEHPSSPIVFEGNAPADIYENEPLTRALATVPEKPPVTARAWLGAPNSIKGPTEATFHRQSGNHLLIIGQREEASLTMLGLSAIALSAQYPAGAAKLIFLHASVPGSADAVFVDRLAAAIPRDFTIATPNQVPELLAELSADLKARAAGETPDAPEVFVFIHGLPRFKKLRYEDDFSFGSSDSGPGAQMNELINEGSAYGIHLLASVDTFSNLNRFVNRKALGEFEMRVVFQMGANDSASLIDSPKASALGLHRAILYHESQGLLETFRPYAMPEGDWLEKAAERLRQRS